MPPLSHVSISTARRTTDNSPFFYSLTNPLCIGCIGRDFSALGFGKQQRMVKRGRGSLVTHLKKKEGELEISENLHGGWDVIRKVEGNLRRITMALRAIIKPGAKCGISHKKHFLNIFFWTKTSLSCNQYKKNKYCFFPRQKLANCDFSPVSRHESRNCVYLHGWEADEASLPKPTIQVVRGVATATAYYHNTGRHGHFACNFQFERGTSLIQKYVKITCRASHDLLQ